jgi:DNA-nicking Smr family endonuclease
MARRRGSSAEDAEIWARVAATVAPLHPQRPAPVPDARPAPDPAPAVSAPERAPRAPLPRFRVGEAAQTRIASPEAGASPAQRLAAGPLNMDPKTHRRMTRGKLRPEARLDLHGMTLAVAHPQLIQFVASCHAAGLRLVLVITGKGRGDHGPLPTRPGALRHHVPFWLHGAPLAPLVQQVTAAHDRHGGEGAYYVYLRRPRV